MNEVVHIGSLSDSVSISETGLAVIHDLTFDQWSSLMGTLSRMDTAFQFALGDALNYGSTKYGERYTQAIEMTGQSYQSLANYAWVSKAVTIDRRVAGLSWTHHRVVARLDPDEQVRLLSMAKENDWTISALAEEVRGEPVTKTAPELIPVPEGMTPKEASDILSCSKTGHTLCDACPFRKESQ